MFKPTVVLAATLLCAPVFAQTEQTQPARTLLTQFFQRMKVPFAIGPGIDGDITLSTSYLSSATPDQIKLLLATLPYNTEYRIDTSGMHIVRRKPDTQAANSSSPNVSAAAPKAGLSPTLFLSYKDALQWELTRTELERERIKAIQQDVDVNALRGMEVTISMLKRRLAELNNVSRSTMASTTSALNYSDALRLELLHAEMEMAGLRASFGPGHPDVRNKQAIVDFLKRRVVEMEARTAQPARKTAQR